MAEDPKVKAHNERMRQQRIAEEQARETRRRKEADEHMQRQIRLSSEAQQTKGKKDGCAVLFIAMMGAPLATIAFKWIA